MEVTMASADASSGSTNQPSGIGTDMNLEVVSLPVADVDRAKNFYLSLGWRLDADIAAGDYFRLVQFTPPHSGCSIHFGKGVSASKPGSVDRLILAVEDIDAARNDLISRGVDVSEAYHYERRPGHTGELDSRVPGPDPQRGRSYWVYASFSDPDGNGWLLQEITTRLPGREWEPATSVASLAHLLQETAEHHGHFEAVAPPHDWWDWYAAYMTAREAGSSPDEAAESAGRYMAEAKHIVVSGT
jgi:catechol 2,3-dioxygenase-like lactoylglutathione lyase family enzyme